MKKDHRKELYSFDIFDTCLTRSLTHPKDLFYGIAHRFLKKHCPYYYDHVTVEFFVKNRILSERVARNTHRARQEDINLFDIYKTLQETLPWQFDVNQAMLIEMDVEKQYLRPILPIKLKIDQLRQQGHQIIFISDMYLPTAFIRQCLIYHNIAYTDDHIYVSGDIGLTKHSGNLYKKVLELEKIKPHELFHCGDNFHSDVKMAQRQGIRTEHFTCSHLTPYECQNFIKIKPQSMPTYSKFSGVSRLTRINTSMLDEKDVSLNRLSSNVIAPLLTAYVLWVLSDAKQKGIKRLYFVSRDGQILYKIAQKFTHRKDLPTCHYLYGSRQAWYLPTVTHINETDLNWLAHVHDCKTPRQMLARLNATPEELNDYLFNFNLTHFDKELNKEELAIFWRFLKSQEVQSIILSKAKLSLDLINCYFHQEGLFLDHDWAIVDTGWRLTCQKALQRILNLCGYRDVVKGYYLGVRKDHVTSPEVGMVYPFISHSQSDLSGLKNHDWLFDQGVASVIENVFTIADHPPVIGFQLADSTVTPIYKNDFYKHDIQILRNKIENSIFQYIIHLKKEVNIDQNIGILIDSALKSAKHFFTNPPTQDILAISWVPVDIEQYHDETNSRILASPLSFRHLAKMAVYVLNPIKGRFVDTHHAWYKGSAAISTWSIRLLFSLLTSGHKRLSSIRQYKKQR